jgi:hypothetical protein
MGILENNGNLEKITHLSLALPINKESKLIDLKHAAGFILRIILLLSPPIKNTPILEWLWRRNLPIKFKLFGHFLQFPILERIEMGKFLRLAGAI